LTRCSSTLAVLVATRARHRHDRRAAEALVEPQILQHAVAVDPGQLQAEEHQLGISAACRRERGVAVVRKLHVVAQMLEQHREALRGLQVLVDHQHAARRAPAIRFARHGEAFFG
jgi:hypothetical protein